MKKITIIAALAAVLLALPCASARAEVKIVANPGVPVASLDAATLENLFLGRQSAWSDGTPVTLAVLKSGPAAEEFLRVWLKKTPSQFETFWKKAVFSGTGTPPAEFATDADMAAFVASMPGAIGYLAAETAAKGVKVIPAK